MDESRIFFLELNLKLVSSVSLYDSMNSLFAEAISNLSVFSSDPLFSCAIAFCTLVFLYLPQIFWKTVFSPVLILTWVLLLNILRLGAIQKSRHKEDKENENHRKHSELVKEENRGNKEEKQRKGTIEPKETKSMEQVQEWIRSQTGFESSSCFVEWNVKAPLGVIYEEYEGEEGEEETGEHASEKEENHNMGVIQRYPSLSCYYPESDSDGLSESGFPATGECDLPGNSCLFRWEWDDEEDDKELIEIALDGCVKKRDMEFHFEEENLIEIDISSIRDRELSGEVEEAFSGEISCH